MDMKFHLERQTGGLTRAIDRGTKGISFILSSIVFHVIPTALEITMVCAILVRSPFLSSVAKSAHPSSVVEVWLGLCSCDCRYNGSVHLVHGPNHGVAVSPAGHSLLYALTPAD